MATIQFIDAFLDKGEGFAAGYKDLSLRLLAPEVLPVTIDGALVKAGGAVAPRPAAETAALAAQLGARVATAADTIWCGGGECHGTMGLQIRLGDPVITGDSAVVVYSLLRRGTTGRMLPSRINRFAVYLRRLGGEWKVTSSVIANQNRVTPLPPESLPPRRRGGP